MAAKAASDDARRQASQQLIGMVGDVKRQMAAMQYGATQLSELAAFLASVELTELSSRGGPSRPARADSATS